MLIPNQYIVVKWNPNNKKHYESFGYKFTKFNDEFKVKPIELPSGSKRKVKVKCDYCGKEFEIARDNLTRTMKGNGKIACKQCSHIKQRETMLEKYGVEYPIQNKEIKEKIAQTNIERYGVDNPLKNGDIKQKVKNTLMEKYGVDSPYKSKEIKEKALETLKERYGCECYFSTAECREKTEKTLLEKYGVHNIMEIQEYRDKAKATCMKLYGGESSQSSLEVRKKTMETLLKNGEVPSSRAEQDMVKVLKEMYGEENCFPQYPLDRIFFDCRLNYNGLKIDVEFDGEFWHKDREVEDNKRDYFVKNNGFKVIRFRSKGNVPTKKQIEDCVNYLVDNKHWRIKINI